PVESFEHRLGDVKADLRRQQFREVIHVDRAFVPCREDTGNCIVRVDLRRIAPRGSRRDAFAALSDVHRLSAISAQCASLACGSVRIGRHGFH
ncbi:MAG TPA: hypothetical protein VGM85_18365, partial [Paraburkholderia sp.]